MIDFVARIGTAGGEVVERDYAAADESALRQELNAKGLYVFTIKKKSGGEGWRKLFQRKERVPAKAFSIFNHELATLLKAGMPLLQGLDILLDRMHHPFFKRILADIRDEVRSGVSLSDAFAAYPDQFPPLYATSLRAGERSGEMEGVIRRYLSYAKIVGEIRKKVIQAMIYPAFLFSSSLISIVVLMKFAIPKFAELYESFDSELPPLTVFVLAIADLINDHLGWVIAGMIVGFGAVRYASQSERGRDAIDRAKLRMPFAGSIWQKFAVSQLTRALSTLLRGGIPLVTALEVSSDSVGNRLIAKLSRSAAKDIREGQPLSYALEQTGALQPMVIEMVRVGESTGALAEMLENVADYYDEDIREELQRMLTLLEPALLMVMGGIIAFLLIAMYLPVFNLQSAIE